MTTTSTTPPAYDQSFFDEPDYFQNQPEPETTSYAEESDPFADSQIDHLVEETEMRSARSFNSSVDAGTARTRRPRSSRRGSKIPDGKSGQARRRNIRSMLTIPLAILAVVGLVLMLLVSNASSYPTPSVEIKIAPPPSTIAHPTIELPPRPTRPAPIRPVKMPRKPQPPALLTSTDTGAHTDASADHTVAESLHGLSLRRLVCPTHLLTKPSPNRRLNLDLNLPPTSNLTSIASRIYPATLLLN